MYDTLLRLQARALDSLSAGVSVTEIDTRLISCADRSVDRLLEHEPGATSTPPASTKSCVKTT